jgi:hypothetical protein
VFDCACTVHDNPLHDLKVRIWCAVSLHKIVGLVFFEEANSYHHIKLILTPLFRELKDEDKK